MAEHNRRAQERSQVMLVVRFAGEPHVHRPRARDIDAGGVRLTHHAEARVGRAVVVEFAAIGAVPGTVAWVEGEEIVSASPRRSIPSRRG